MMKKRKAVKASLKYWKLRNEECKQQIKEKVGEAFTSSREEKKECYTSKVIPRTGSCAGEVLGQGSRKGRQRELGGGERK